MDYPHLRDQNYLQFELKKKLTDILGKTGAKGLSVAVCGKTSRIAAASDGIISAATCEPVTENTVFWADGLAAPILAYAAFKLQEQGRLDLTAPLCRYLSEPFLPGDRDLPKVTGQMVLTHTAGLPMRKNPDGPTKLILPPGTYFSYSALGILYLQRVMEQITGQDLQTYLQDTIFRPFRMASTSLVWKEDFTGRFAYPHDKKGKENHYIKAEKPNASRYFYTTPSDYCAFLNKLFAPQTSPKYCLSSESLAQLLLPCTSLYGNLHWARGIGAAEEKGSVRYWTFADQEGSKALAMIDPGANIGICVLSNGNEGRKACEVLLRELTGTAFSPSLNYFGPSLKKAAWKAKGKLMQKKFAVERDKT